MNLKDRTNLLNDLCARIPYGIKCQCLGRVGTIRSIDTFGNTEVEGFSGSIVIDVSHVKPYLFPMSSMTEDQIEEFNSYFASVPYYGGNEHEHVVPYYFVELLIEFFHKNHIDNNGLISKGLAIDATGLNIY